MITLGAGFCMSLFAASEFELAIEGVWFNFRERGRRREGFLCNWYEQLGSSGWLFALAVIAPEKPALELVRRILDAVGSH